MSLHRFFNRQNEIPSLGFSRGPEFNALQISDSNDAPWNQRGSIFIERVFDAVVVVKIPNRFDRKRLPIESSGESNLGTQQIRSCGLLGTYQPVLNAPPLLDRSPISKPVLVQIRFVARSPTGGERLSPGGVNGFKQRFVANPAEAVPELQYLTDRDWLEFVTYDHHRIAPECPPLIHLNAFAAICMPLEPLVPPGV